MIGKAPPPSPVDAQSARAALPKNAIALIVLDVDGVLTDGGLYYSADGEVMKKFNVKDGLGIRLAQKAGIEVAILSGGRQKEIVQARAKDLGIKEISVGKTPKDQTLKNWMDERGLTGSAVAYLGDDLNDLAAMALCGHTACPADAPLPVKKAVNTVLSLSGGAGCVREYISDHILAGKKAL